MKKVWRYLSQERENIYRLWEIREVIGIPLRGSFSTQDGGYCYIVTWTYGHVNTANRDLHADDSADREVIIIQ